MDTTNFTLENGLRVVAIPMPWLRSVSVAVFVHVGSRFETEFTSGISHLTEHMMFKGTPTRPRSAHITGALESVGGILNASTDKEVTLYWSKAAAEHLSLSMDVVSDMLCNSLIRPSDVAREREVIAEELRMISDDPQDWSFVLADEALWPGHPYGREIAGSQASVASFRRKDILHHLQTFYGPTNAVIAVAGGVASDVVQRQVNSSFGNWQPVPAVPFVAPPKPTAGGTWLLEDKDFEQLNVCLVFPGVHREHPDRAPLEVLATILGGGASSRLFEQMRERRGLAYDVGASTTLYEDVGSFIVSFGTDPQKGSAALDCALQETERIQRRKVSDAELSKAKQLYSGRLWLALEDTNAVAGWYGSQETLQTRVVTPEESIRLVMDVSQDDVRRVAQTYLRIDGMRVTAVGPTASLSRHTLKASA